MDKMLIIDDDKMNCKLLQKSLINHGRCDVAHDGVEALQLFFAQQQKNDPYAVIFLDINMPNLDGPNTLKLIRSYENAFQITNYAKICILTADSDKKKAMDLFKEGCEDHLIKPYTNESVQTILKKYSN